MKNLLRVSFLIIFYVNVTIPCLYGEIKENEESKTAYFPNLIPNPGLENDNDNDLIPDFWEIEGLGQKEVLLTSEGVAHRGKKAVSLNGKGAWHCSVKDIEPDKYYLFSFWVKRDGWQDDEYPAMRIFDREMYLDELFSWGAWMRMSWYINSGEMKQTEIKFINPGMSHRIYFDDIQLIKCGIDLLLPEDNCVLNTALPEFVWKVPHDDKILDLKIELSRKDDFEDKISLSTVNALGSSFKIKDRLDIGNWYWRIRVYKNNNMIASSETRSFSVKPAPFPIGIYGATQDAFGELKEAGFNCVLASSAKDYVLSAKEYGLKCIVSIPDKGAGDGLNKRIMDLIDTKNILCWYLEDEPEGRGVSPILIWKWGNYIRSFDANQLTGLALVRSGKANDYGDAVDVLMVDTYPIPRRPMTWLSDSIDESYRSMSNKRKQVWAVIQAFDWRYFGDSPMLKNARNPTLEEERCLTYLAIVHGARGILYYTYKGGKYEIKNFPEHWNDVKKIASEINILSPVLTAPDKSVNPLLNLKAKISSDGRLGAKVAGLKERFTGSDDSGEGEMENASQSQNTPACATGANGESAIHYLFKSVSYELLNGSRLFDGIRKNTDGATHASAANEEKEVRFIIAVNVIDAPIDAIFCSEQLGGDCATVLFENRDVRINNGKIEDHFDPYGVHIYMIDEG